MFSDTIVIPVYGADRTFTRINQDGYTGEFIYRGTDLDMSLAIRHSSYTDKATKTLRDRHNVELKGTILATPTTLSRTFKVYFVVEGDKELSPAYLTGLMEAISSFAGNDAFNAKVANWES